MHKRLILLVVLALTAIAVKGQSKHWQLGRAPSSDELRQRDITVLPNGAGLPDGRGTAVEGEVVYRNKCLSCHGTNQEGTWPLIGGVGTLGSANPVKTVGSYWAYSTSIWDYVRRGMPFDKPGTLSPDEVYQVTAFLLYRNGIIGQNEVMTRETLPKVRMPNRDGFIPDGRPDVGNKPRASRSQN